MHKSVRSALLAVVALMVAAVPALGQEQQAADDLDKLAGVYEFEAPDYGVVSITVAITEERAVTIAAMGQVPQSMTHIEGNLWELNSAEFGLINIAFVEEADGSISAIAIDSYDFSFMAYKKQ